MTKKVLSVTIKSKHLGLLNAIYGFAVCNQDTIFKNMPMKDQMEMRQALSKFFKTYLDFNQNLRKKDRPTNIHSGGDVEALFKMIELAKGVRKTMKENHLRMKEALGDKDYATLLSNLDECCADMGGFEKKYRKHLNKGEE